jgi:hypothetical protein
MFRVMGGDMMMRQCWIVAALLMSMVAVSVAQPVQWELPGGGAWQRTTHVDPNGGPCLVYTGGAAQSEPFKQTVMFLCVPGREHMLTIHANGHDVAPVVRVLDYHSRELLAEARLQVATAWGTTTLAFTAKTADILIELHAGANSAPGEMRIAAALSAAGGGAVVQRDAGVNIALNKPYTMDGSTYGGTRDDGDATQLTDGVYTEGYFWGQKTTVGWSGPVDRFVTVDLGEVEPINGASFSTAGGVADVQFPMHISIFTSDDGEQWYDAGDLVELSDQQNPTPEYGEYATHRFHTNALATRGRYVTFCIETNKHYLFCDEIEIYRGDASLLDAPRPERIYNDVRAFREAGIVREQLLRDLHAVRGDIDELPGATAQQATFAAQADALVARIEDMEAIDMSTFLAITPMNDLHRDIFALQAAVWRQCNKPAWRAWSMHRWEMLEATDEPADSQPAEVVVHMLNNEHRAGVFNLTNASDGDATVRLTSLADYVTVYEVQTVGTRHFVSVSAALPEAKRDGDAWLINVPRGMTRQVWLDFHPDGLAAGLHESEITVRPGDGTELTVQVRLHIYPPRFPDQTTMYLGGWSDTNQEKIYGVTPENREPLIKLLRSYRVNAPWATSRVLPAGKYDAEGNMTKPPSTDAFEAWAAMWPDTTRYMVFRPMSDTFEGSKMGTPEFDRKVGAWARFWADHMIARGEKPEKLGLLLVDEPHDKAKYDIITAYARAINAVAPELTLFEDPQCTEPNDALEMFGVVDILCPYRMMWYSRPDFYKQMFLDARDQGKELWFYSANGPARTFDPYAYYLLQAWHIWQVGGKGMAFWAFGDPGRNRDGTPTNCWNEYTATGNGPYCPIYMDSTSVTTAKYMEAIREGAQDYEYMVMLRDAIAHAHDSPALRDAMQLLATAADRVMADETGTNWRWDNPRDRTVVDQVRVEILESLAALHGD